MPMRFVFGYKTGRKSKLHKAVKPYQFPIDESLDQFCETSKSIKIKN